MFRAWRFVKAVMGIIFRHPVLGVTLVAVLPDSRFVLVRRRDTGQWALPGGMVDWGQDVPTTARRELLEETGLELVEIRRLIGVYSSPDRDPRIHSITITLEVAAKGNLAVRDTLEIFEARAFALEELPLGKLAHDHDRQLKDYLAGITVVN